MPRGQSVIKKHDIGDILARYVAGEPVPSIAASCGVARQRIYEAMLADIGASGYEDLVTRALVRHVADADNALADAREPADIARAREQARFARMDLERRRSALYGQRSHVTVETVGDLGDRLRRARARQEHVIEHDDGKSLTYNLGNDTQAVDSKG